jgi:hypothetical protein
MPCTLYPKKGSPYARKHFWISFPRSRLWIILLVVSTLLAACDSGSEPHAPTPPTRAPKSQPASTADSTPGTPITSQGDPSPTVDAGYPTKTPAAQGDTGSVQPDATSTPEAPREPSSSEKIAAAEKSGKLDHDTALLYTVYAGFDPGKLPAEYRGDGASSEAEAGATLGDLASRFDSLSSSVKSGAEPFLLRPDDPSGAALPALAPPARGVLSLSVRSPTRRPPGVMSIPRILRHASGIRIRCRGRPGSNGHPACHRDRLEQYVCTRAACDAR